MKKTKILVLAEFFDKSDFWTDPEYHEMISSFGDDVEFDFAQDLNPKQFDDISKYVLYMETNGPEWITPSPEVLEKVADADVLLVGMSGVSSKIIDAGKNLKFIGAMRSGFENVNKAYAESKGITVRNCPGRLANPVADMTLAMMISETRGILRGNLVTNHGQWHKMDIYDDTTNRPMSSLKVGLVGYGMIGRKLAARLRACESEVLAYDPYTPQSVFDGDGVKKYETLEEMIPKCDIICMMARLTEDTRGMFGKQQFALMKPTAIFCNTARAGLVDEASLVEALETKKIRGACLDTYSQEPLPEDHPLLRMNNVTLMPHRAGVTPGMGQQSMKMMFKTLRNFLNGEKV